MSINPDKIIMPQKVLLKRTKTPRYFAFQRRSNDAHTSLSSPGGQRLLSVKVAHDATDTQPYMQCHEIKVENNPILCEQNRLSYYLK